MPLYDTRTMLDDRCFSAGVGDIFRSKQGLRVTKSIRGQHSRQHLGAVNVQAD